MILLARTRGNCYTIHTLKTNNNRLCNTLHVHIIHEFQGIQAHTRGKASYK